MYNPFSLSVIIYSSVGLWSVMSIFVTYVKNGVNYMLGRPKSQGYNTEVTTALILFLLYFFQVWLILNKSICCHWYWYLLEQELPEIVQLSVQLICLWVLIIVYKSLSLVGEWDQYIADNALYCRIVTHF